MPTFTTIALENLIEPTVRISLKKSFDSDDDETKLPMSRHLYISPGLYATPEQSPIAQNSTPDPISPSPYVVNLKRRRSGTEMKTGVTNLPLQDDEVLEENFVNRKNLVVDDDGDNNNNNNNVEMMSEAEDEEEEEEVRQIETRSFASAQGEFFDANDDFSSDASMSSAHSYAARPEFVLNAIRLSLNEETEKRKAAEETLNLMCCQWERITKLMNDAGFTFPALPVTGNDFDAENNLLEKFSQEVTVTRVVAEAVGRGEARAEAEEAFASVIDLKDQEILRLRDRLQYYETMNHEMSQRKLVEVAKRQQQKKKSRRRWIWSFTVLSVVLGASAVAYTYGIADTQKYISVIKSIDVVSMFKSNDDASIALDSETTS